MNVSKRKKQEICAIYSSLFIVAYSSFLILTYYLTTLSFCDIAHESSFAMNLFKGLVVTTVALVAAVVLSERSNAEEEETSRNNEERNRNRS